ncbi:MAG: hypothetical protein HUK21_05620 [Fibrobacteraceae bacterium]|nr:hypothetical protein [Fibrobacteraceae bacterium]
MNMLNIFLLIVLILFAGCSTPKKESLIDDFPIDGGEIPGVIGYGSVVDYEWENIVPWYSETTTHSYGFDKDPVGNLINPDARKETYASTAKGIPASVLVDLSTVSGYESYKMKKYNGEIEEDIPGLAPIIPLATTNHNMIELYAGRYSLYGINNAGEHQLGLYVTIFEYEPLSKDISYVQYGTCNESDVNCYTADRVRDNFNRVYGQVVLSANLTEKKATEFGLPQKIEYDASTQFTEKTNMPFYNWVIPINLSIVKRENSLYDRCVDVDDVLTNESCFEAYKEGSAYPINFVAALNEMSIYWVVHTTDVREAFVLNNIYHSGMVGLVNKVSERSPINVTVTSCENRSSASSAQIVLESLDLASGTAMAKVASAYQSLPALSTGCFEISITSSDVLFPLPVSVGQNDKGEIVCDDDGEPMVYSAAQVTYLQNDENSNVTGGLIFSPVVYGEASQNTVQHEIGHAMGLRDKYIPVNEKECLDGGTLPECVVSPSRDNNGNPQPSFSYVTTEANLMNYLAPTGPKLRYRLMPIVKTGTNTIVQEKDELGNLVNVNESQWDCLRNGNCVK